MIVPSSSYRELLDSQTPQDRSPTSSVAETLESDSTVTETKEEGGLGHDKMPSQNRASLKTVFLGGKQTSTAVSASLIAYSTKPLRKSQAKTPPSDNIETLQCDGPEFVDSNSARRPPPIFDAEDEAKARRHASKRNVQHCGDRFGTSRMKSIVARSDEVVNANISDSMYPPREHRNVSSRSATAGDQYIRQAEATLKLNSYLATVARSPDLIQSSRDEITRLSLASLSLAAEEERLLKSIMAQQAISAAAAEVNKVAYESFTPSQRLFAMERFALVEQERELKRFMLERERVLVLQAQKEQERQRQVQRMVLENEEVARRRRLSAALFGSAKPKAAEMASDDVHKKREPEAVVGTHRPIEKSRNGGHKVAGRTQSETNRPSNVTPHHSVAFNPPAYIDPLWYCQQRQQLQQQQATLNGLTAFQTALPPFPASPLNSDATFEQLLLLQHYSHL